MIKLLHIKPKKPVLKDLFEENQAVIEKTLESLEYNGVRCIRELKTRLDIPTVDKPKT